MTDNGYLPTIGIECHVQLKTKTKLFVGVSNDAREAPPNTLISHVCMGLPGALPVLNENAINLAMRAAFALGTRPQKFSVFDRKHYFYPDLPKGYQISQYKNPIILGGHVDIEVGGKRKRVGITRAHLEEDAGKSTHEAGKDYSLIDLNRAGTPLLEIVSEPDINSPEEAKAFARELYLLMKYADVSDANLYYGNMRFDVNVSVSDKKGVLGTRTETKNLNSFRSVEKAVEYEIKRQIEVLKKGEKVVQETRGWDDAKQKTFTQRTKEEAHDYRYFPDPDIPPVVLDDAKMKDVESAMPVLPAEWRKKFHRLNLDTSAIETLIEAEVESPDVKYLPLVESYLDDTKKAKFLINFFVNVEIPLRRNPDFDVKLDHEASQKALLSIYDLLAENKLSSTKAKELFEDLLSKGELPHDIAKYAEEKGYIQISDTSEIEDIVEQVIQENEKAAQDVRNGEAKAVGFLVGQVMKLSKGKANPALAQEILKKKLNG